MNKLFYKNSTDAFENLYHMISVDGYTNSSTRYIDNLGFYIQNPRDRIIKTSWRNFKEGYAKLEWAWYLSENPKAIEISKYAKIWEKCMDEEGFVNSNYGYQWSRGKQLDYVVKELKRDPESRRASLSIYDAKNRYNFERDTPCTYAINFCIRDSKLCMSVLMRSNDLWYGFCNDQYCFSKLQDLIADRLALEVGWYYHFTNNMHIYNNFLSRNE